LREGLRGSLVPEASALTLREGAFVQVIEFRTGRLPEFQQVEDGWREAIGSDRTVQWVVVGADRSVSGRYMQLVGFPDYDSAMANSKHPATSSFAKKLGEVCEGEAVFHDLDVRRVEVF